MLPLPPLSLLRPRTVAEACRALADHEGARIVSGGTDLLPSMKYGLFSPPTLISTSRVEGLGEVAAEEGGLRLGAGLTLARAASHPLVRARLPALAAACRTVATPTLQAMGTLGGNLMLDTRCIWYNQSSFWRGALGGCLKCETQPGAICHVAPKGRGCYAAHSADTVPVLTLHEAVARFESVRGVREVPLSNLYQDDGRAGVDKAPDELLVSVFVPWLPAGEVVVHRKLRARGSVDYGVLLTAVRRGPEGGRVVLSALGPRPLEVQGVSPLIAAGALAEAAELAWRQATPLNTHTMATTWRKKMVRVEVRRALEAAG